MPNFSGIWTASQQFQARGQNIWPAVPGAPTIGTATATGATSVSVAFTPPTYTGYPAGISSYTATSTPGCLTGTAVSSPITVSGLTTGTTYTFKVKATNTIGTGPESAASNSVTTWTTPGAPTIGTATPITATTATVAYTAPASDGGTAITSYTATSTPGCITGSVSQAGSGTITVSGLTTGTTYTFKVKATNAVGTGPESAASNSVTPAVTGQQAYTAAGTYSWVAPTGVTKVSVVAVGGGAQRGGSLAWTNNITVVPGNTYSVAVGQASQPNGGVSSFQCTIVRASGGCGVGYPSITGDGGGFGGVVSSGFGVFGGGAGGYSGNGGTGNGGSGGNATSVTYCGCTGQYGGAGGGGVGILGEGASGANGTGGSRFGKGGSGGANGTDFSGGWVAGSGGAYGGGRGIGSNGGGSASAGAVRIIWPGNTRSFPSTNTGDL